MSYADDIRTAWKLAIAEGMRYKALAAITDDAAPNVHAARQYTELATRLWSYLPPEERAP